MQRGSDRLSRRRDDEMKHELQGMLRSGHSTRTEEWNDPEPVADDDPQLATGATGTFEEVRFELARHLTRATFPAGRGDLLRSLDEHHAPDRMVRLVTALPPERAYASVQDVALSVTEA
ncbi:DUF2795 domain-containing protein [Streptomyces sp. NBC_00344]|uniref:DUF2795 domain-containing protein n=1 Tax=Streptomyces sp. NBC_00344 TaxID=2975720 RepID=UPI002E1CA933